MQNNNHKIVFDIDLSKKLCPPETYYSQFEGVKYIKRIVLKRDLVSFKKHEQIREIDAHDSRAIPLHNSYLQFGFVHSKAPQAIEVDLQDKKRFVGRAGWGRDKAQELLGYDSFLYDVLEFESPKHRIEFMFNSNDTEDHLPAFANTLTTIMKGVVQAVQAGTISKDDDKAILNFMMLIAKSKGEKVHKRLLKKLRREKFAKYNSMRAWCTADANDFAEDNKLPYEGDKNTKTNSLGYVRKKTSWKNLFWDALVKTVANKFKPVYFSSWIDEPKPSELHVQRKDVIDDFDEHKKMLDSWICHYTGLSKEKLKEVSKGKFPLIFNGFLPQNVEPNPKDNGNYMEKGLVDKDGNKWTRLDQ
jgi:hypothetical protein